MRFCDLDRTPVKYSVAGLLTDCGNLYINAYQKSGKTTLVLQLLKSFDTGEEFIGRTVRKTTLPWLYLNLELPQNMLAKYAEDEGLDLESWNLLVADYVGASAELLELLTDPTLREGKKMFSDLAGVIIDPLAPLASANGIDSDNNDQMRGLLEEIGACMKAHGVPQIIVVDHTGHQDKGRGRGASTKGDWADVIWNFEREPAQEVGTLRVVGRGIMPTTLRFRKDGDKLLPSDELGPARTQRDERIDVIREAREANPEFSQRAIAKLIDIPQSTVQRFWAKAAI